MLLAPMDVLARGNNTATQRKMPTVIVKKHNALFLFLFEAIRHDKKETAQKQQHLSKRRKA